MLYFNDVIIKPLVTEKSTNLQKNGVYVFKVNQNRTREQIKIAIEKYFEVKVIAVRVARVKGKTKKFKQKIGSLSNWKKAYVHLDSSDSIDYSKLMGQGS